MIKKVFYFVFISAACVVMILSCRSDKGTLPKPLPTCDTSKICYCSKIKALVDKECNTSGCHNSGSSNGDYTTYAGIKAKATDGTLNTRVLVDQDMPPAGALPQPEMDLIDQWVKAGAWER